MSRQAILDAYEAGKIHGLSGDAWANFDLLCERAEFGLTRAMRIDPGVAEGHPIPYRTLWELAQRFAKDGAR